MVLETIKFACVVYGIRILLMQQESVNCTPTNKQLYKRTIFNMALHNEERTDQFDFKIIFLNMYQPTEGI